MTRQNAAVGRPPICVRVSQISYRLYDAVSGTLFESDVCDRCPCTPVDMCVHGCYPQYHYADTRLDIVAVLRADKSSHDNSSADSSSHDSSSNDSSSADTHSKNLSAPGLPLPLSEIRAVARADALSQLDALSVSEGQSDSDGA